MYKKLFAWLWHVPVLIFFLFCAAFHPASWNYLTSFCGPLSGPTSSFLFPVNSLWRVMSHASCFECLNYNPASHKYKFTFHWGFDNKFQQCDCANIIINLQVSNPFKITGLLFVSLTLKIRDFILHTECIYWFHADMLLRIIVWLAVCFLWGVILSSLVIVNC